MDEYESGFGDVSAEHWIGFKTLDKYDTFTAFFASKSLSYTNVP